MIYIIWNISIHFINIKNVYDIFFEREGEKHVQDHSVDSHTHPTRDPACNTGMCPDQESNLRPSSSQTSVQSTEPYPPGLHIL